VILKTSCKGRVIAQAVSRRLVTAETWNRAQGSSCGICGRHSGTGTGFSESFGFPLSISFHRCSIFTRIFWGMDIGPVRGPVL
jgi:hypothetical protein